MSNVNPPVVQQTPPQKSNTGLTLTVVLAVVAVPVLLVCTGILVGLLLPAVQAAREAARRVECSNHLKVIALAALNYESANRAFPPAYTTDEDGQPLHSWRTLLLPYMGQQALYDSIDLSKPWDDPANQLAASTVVPEFNCPSSPGGPTDKTIYQVVVDPNGMFPGSDPTAIRLISDGLSNTVMVVETPDSMAVPWMSTEDCDLQDFLSYTEARHAQGFNVAMGDGSVHFISKQADAAARQAMVTRAGGEGVSLD